MSSEVEGQLSGKVYDLKFLVKYAIGRRSCTQQVQLIDGGLGCESLEQKNLFEHSSTTKKLVTKCIELRLSCRALMHYLKHNEFNVDK